MQQIGSIVVLMVLVVAGMFLIQEKDTQQPASPPFSVVSVPFTEVLRGDQSSVKSRVNYLITAEEGLTELVKLIGTKNTLPEVDFDTHFVVAVFAGEQTIGGHRIAINKVEDVPSSRTVTIDRISPGEGCSTTQVLTSPYQVVTVPVTELAFTHEDTLVAVACK